MRTRAQVAVGLVVATVIGLSLLSPAQADDSADRAAEIEEILLSVPEEYGILDDPAGGQETPQTSVPDDPTDGLTLASDHGEIAVGLPFADQAADGVRVDVSTVAYDNGNNSVTVPTAKRDGSIQVSTVLEARSAPSEYSYTIDVEGLTKIELYEDGVVAFLGTDGSFLGGVAAPWAVDAAGRSVPTHFTVTGSTLTQVVEHTGGGFTYPIVADPWLGNPLYYNAYVTYTSKGHKVNTQPTDWGVAYSGNAIWWAHRDEVKGRLGSNASKYNASIEQQHYCHLLGVPFSLPVFNLESWRPNMSALSQAPYKCNYPEGYYN